MLACILNINPEKLLELGSISPKLLLRGVGGGVISRNDSKNGSTPKLVRALPKNTGVNSPLNIFSKSKLSPAISKSSISSSNFW